MPSSFFSRVMGRAGGYLARITIYLGSIAALVTAYWKVIRPLEATPPGLAEWLLIALAGLPLLVALIVEFALWQQRRCRRLLIEGQVRAGYFTLGPRSAKDHDEFQLPDDAHKTALEWVRAAAHPILHLTGLSGTGKSSLIQAWLVPELERSGSHSIVILRSFDDPLDDLRYQLIGQWDSPPATATRPDLPLPELVGLAARYLDGKSRRLLIIFDQFEEYFVLHPQAGQAEPLRNFFHAILEAPPSGVTILLSYRKDHAHALAALRLPPVSNDPNHNLTVNGLSLRPFTIAEAKAFYTRSGLALKPQRLDLALAEAASYEETRAHIRPIVLNVLGRILSTLSDSPAAARQARGLIRTQVRQWALSTSLEEGIRPVLEKLVSSSGTVIPASEANLATAAQCAAAQVQPALDDLAICGLLRCLSPEQTEPEKRIWQASHDFIARLFALIIEGLNKTLWRALRPWLAPAALGLWALAAFVVWPHYEERWAIRELNRLEFGLDVNTRRVEYGKGVNRQWLITPHLSDETRLSPAEWRNVVRALRSFRCRSLDLGGWESILSLDGLGSLKQLEELDLTGCEGLESLPDLSACAKLTKLDLDRCTGLRGAAALQGLANLRSLEELILNRCTGLESLPDLSACSQLKSLNLSGCTGMKGAAALQGLTGLRSLEWLSLTGFMGLEMPDVRQIRGWVPQLCRVIGPHGEEVR